MPTSDDPMETPTGQLPVPDPPAPPRRFTWRGRTIVIVIAVLGLLLIGGAAMAHTFMHMAGAGCGGG